MSSNLRYNLQKLEWQQFEQLSFNCIQSLISPSVEFIEGGSDKGRDFIFEGASKFFGDDLLERNIVFQAKHKSKDKYCTQLKSDLKKELEKVFIENNLKYDTYCLVTNLTISGDFRDELGEVYKEFLSNNNNLPLKFFKIISYRHLEGVIDQNTAIKYKYSTILSPNDFEALLTKTLRKSSRNASEIWSSIFKKNSERFIYTGVQDKALRIVNEKNIILFSGPPKSGKTFNAQALVFNLCCLEDFSPQFIIDLHSFDQIYDRDARQIFLFDDAFGKHNLDRSRSDILERKLEQIFECIDENHICVFTSREYVFRSFKNFTDKDTSQFIQKITVEVTKLSLSEKESLFERYYKCAFAEIPDFSDHTLNKFVKHAYFSPETVRSFFDQAKSFDIAEFQEHLDRPDQYLATVFKNLTREKQTTLLAILFGLEGDISNVSFSFNNLLSDLGNTDLIHLQEQLDVLESSIIICVDDQYSFYHPSMKEFFLKYLSKEAGSYRSISFKNLNIDYLNFIHIVEPRKKDLYILLKAQEISDLTIGFRRIIENPYSTLGHLNSIIGWLTSEEVQLNLKLQQNNKFRELRDGISSKLAEEVGTKFNGFNYLEFDYLMRNLKILYSQKTLSDLFTRDFLHKTLKSTQDSENFWIVLFHLSPFIEDENDLFKTVSRDWLNEFYIDLKKELKSLGYELFGNSYPEFTEMNRYKYLMEIKRSEEAQSISKKSYADYKQKTSSKWYPRYQTLKRKMNALKMSRPYGFKIYDLLEPIYVPLKRLEENQRNRYYFFLEKGYWRKQT